MPCFDCKQLSELSSSPFFSSAEHLSGFQRSELHEGIVFEKISFCEQGNFEVQISQLICRNGRHALVGIHLKQTSCQWDEELFIKCYCLALDRSVSDDWSFWSWKRKQKFELCFLCIFQHSHLPNYIFSSSMYRVIFSSFSHVPIREALQLWFFVQNFWKHTPPFYPEVALFHLALYCLFCTGNSFF